MSAVTADRTLDVADLESDPIVQFRHWFDDAVTAGVPEPEAMSVSTVSDEGLPSARMVLLKGVDPRGFVFYTNYESDKGRELAAHPVAALVWRWYQLERQVRAGGPAERTTEEESDRYFATRPRGAQLGAWASPQSRVLAGRTDLEAALADVELRFSDRPVPRPPWWGGIRIVPRKVEFWQGRPSRLHDRLRYTRVPDGEVAGWRIERLAP